MGSHGVTCHPADVTFPPLPQLKLVLDLATWEGCEAEFTWLAGYIPRWYTCPKTVTHPSTNRARRGELVTRLLVILTFLEQSPNKRACIIKQVVLTTTSKPTFSPWSLFDYLSYY